MVMNEFHHDIMKQIGKTIDHSEKVHIWANSSFPVRSNFITLGKLGESGALNES